MREPVDLKRIEAFMRELGSAAESPGRVYLTGGGSAVLEGWRLGTIDIDIKLVPEQESVLKAIPALKERLHVNVELAAPDQFIPALDGWEERSPSIRKLGKLSFHHYDFYAQALAKIERGHRQDIDDVRQMLQRGIVDRAKLREHFERIKPRLYRYPAIDPRHFEQAVEAALREG